MGEKNRRRRALPAFLEPLSPTASVINGFLDKDVETEITEQPCLGCGRPSDRASPTRTANAPKPSPGSISVCWSCGHVQAFDENLRFRELTDMEIIDIAGDPELVAMLNLRGKIHQFFDNNDVQGAGDFIINAIRKELRK